MPGFIARTCLFRWGTYRLFKRAHCRDTTPTYFSHSPHFVADIAWLAGDALLSLRVANSRLLLSGVPSRDNASLRTDGFLISGAHALSILPALFV